MLTTFVAVSLLAMSTPFTARTWDRMAAVAQSAALDAAAEARTRDWA